LVGRQRSRHPMRFQRVWTALSQSTPASPSGSVQFDNSGALGGSVNLFWNNSSNLLGIGTNEPGNALDVIRPVHLPWWR
jgi:hypothetical protein